VIRLYCATTNQGKIREFHSAVRRLAPGLLEVRMLPGLAEIEPCPETGATFEQNAIQKALYYGAHASGLLFAEDSGLEVDALGGAPGVYSARFAGEDATDQDNNRLLLERLGGREPRTARYVCMVALVDAGRLARTFRGSVEGSIVTEPRGSNGFGYDPLFFYPPFNATFAEVPLEAKQRVSHRARALEQLVHHLAAAVAGG
jgi:XTP/dITP diphosphohydrolase